MNTSTYLFDSYYDFLTSQDTRRERNPPHTERYVHASTLGYCPLKAALERSGASPVLAKTKAQILSSLHLMRQGSQDAEPLQEALLAGKLEATIELPIYSDTLRLKGRVDAVVWENGGVHIYEFKRRDIPKNAKGGPQPKLADLLQVYAYKMIFEEKGTEVLSMNIVPINRYYFNTWRVESDGMDTVCIGEDGTPLYVAGYGWANEEGVRHFTHIAQEYLDGRRSVPFADPLNDTNAGSWYCFDWKDGEKPKKYKSTYMGKTERTGWAVPSCEFYCHGDPVPREAREVSYESGVYEWVVSNGS